MDIAYIIKFASIDFIGTRKKYLLYRYFKSIDGIMEASYGNLISSGFIDESQTRRLLSLRKNGSTVLKEQLNGIDVITLDDRRYPEKLSYIYDPPVVLFVKGKIPEKKKIAVIGSRKCCSESYENAMEASALMAGSGICIVSGMARGIDTAAHKGALEKGVTIAVLGNGSDICYPSENYILKGRIEENGCSISEYPPGTKPTRYSFPARNRIISGLCDAVVVAEASLSSGALITVDFALEQGKDVYILAKDGKIYGEGASKLVTEGACVVEAGGISYGINK